KRERTSRPASACSGRTMWRGCCAAMPTIPESSASALGRRHPCPPETRNGEIKHDRQGGEDARQTQACLRGAEAADGTRVLVDRLWPRGVKKDVAAIDLWAKDLAPSAE